MDSFSVDTNFTGLIRHDSLCLPRNDNLLAETWPQQTRSSLLLSDLDSILYRIHYHGYRDFISY